VPRRAPRIFLIVLVSILAVVVGVLFFFTSTDVGRERVRRIALGALQGRVNGIVRIGKISGNLLKGLTVADVAITDSAGAPLFTADSVTAAYGLGALASKKVELSGVRLVRPLIVLDRPPGGEWNFRRLFPGDTTTQKDTAGLQWGEWLVFRDVTMVQGRFLVRRPWAPSDSLSAAARDSVAAVAVGGGSRANVVAVPGGYQAISDFRQIDATLPLFRLAHPDFRERRADVSSLRMVAEPFRPPAAEVRDLAGTFLFTGDSLWFPRAVARLPGSRIRGNGSYVYDGGDMALRLRGEEVALADLRWIHPPLPSEGGGSLDFALTWRGDVRDYVARNAEVRVGAQRIAGALGLTFAADTFFLHDTQLRFANLETRLLERIFAFARFPRRGAFTGEAAVAGGIQALRVNGDVAFADQQLGTSRVVGGGTIGVPRGGGFVARGVSARLAPVQVALVRTVAPDFPIGGALTGTVAVDGSTASGFAFRGDLAHAEGAARSHVTGRGEIRLAGARRVDVDVRATPVSLATVGRFAPGLGLRGSANGPIRLHGPLGDLRLAMELTLPDGGVLAADGRFDLAAREKGYAVVARTRLFNANLVMTRAPRTSLTAQVSANGRGFSPATMRARFAADVGGSSLDSVALDTGLVRAAIEGGMLRVDTLALGGAGARVWAGGDFGLVAGREGTLAYRVDVDSLSPFSRFLPTDTGAVAARPLVRRRALELARADSARRADSTAVERAALGAPEEVLVVADTPRSVRRDSIGGRLYAAGAVTGSLAQYALRGRAAVENLAILGNTARRLRAEYGVFGGRAPMRISVGVQGDTVSAAGFAFDSVDARLAYASRAGRAELLVRQGEERDYLARAEFQIFPEYNEVRLSDLGFRFDTLSWTAVGPSTVRWGGPGIEIDGLELRNGQGGRIYVDGRLPTEGSADLQVAIANFELAHLIDLLQGDQNAGGLVSINAAFEGTLRSPRFRGAAGLVMGRWNETPVPELHATFDYAGARLTAAAQAVRFGGTPLMTAEASLPVNLALAGVTGPRLLEAPLTVDIVADSLPLDLVSQLTDVLSQVRGAAVGTVQIRGTPRSPQLAGAMALRDAGFRVVATGMRIQAVNGQVRMRGDSVWVDSIVGRSGGTLAVRGTLGVAELTRPTFDLELTAQNARVLDSDQGRVRADATIAMRGPFDAVRVEGTVGVREGVFYLPNEDDKKVIGSDDPGFFAVADTAQTDNEELLPTPSPFMQNLRMDVQVNVARNTWVRSNEANVEIYGDVNLHVDRRQNAMVVEGLVNTDRGEYTFMSKRFQIRRGSAIFIGIPEVNPTLQITGEYPVQVAGREALTISVVIAGTMRSPRISLQSDAQPPIAQSDLLSYLAFGRSSSSLLQLGGTSGGGGSSSSGGLVGTGAALATRQLAGVALGVLTNELEGEVSRSADLDVFNITTADIPEEAIRGEGLGEFALATNVEAGRYFDAQTFVGLQASLGAPTPGIRVQRRIPRGFVIETSWEHRYRVREPSLRADDGLRRSRAFGVFLIREWRF
jgi:translocation and assembly module TamB